MAELIKRGEAVTIIDHTTGDDITALVVSQLLGQNSDSAQEGATTGVLVQLLRKGGDTLTDYTKKYTSLWQSAMTMAEDEIDRLVNRLVKNKEIPLSEAGKLKADLNRYGDHLKTWVGEKVDSQVSEILVRMNLTSKEQVSQLSDRIEALNQKIARLEKKGSYASTRKRRVR